MLLPTLIMFVDLLLGVELPSPVNFLGSCLFISACMSVPANFGKKEKQPEDGYENKFSQAVLFGYLCTSWLIFGYGINQFMSGEPLGGEFIASILIMLALLPGV